ncbi:MAG: DNA replication/repair protein RecF, partial [Spirochaetales bacterium]|nr:DNA replication/repair protein RecF [Spirochaetales bacterium]
TVRIHRNSKKEIIVDSKRIEDRKELVKNSPCILFSHDDMVFVKGSPERKRWFLNQTLSLYEPLFIDVLREYQVILRNRNELLKKRNFELIDYYNQAFINNGLKITGKRDSLITEFNDIFTPFFNEITNYEFEKGVKIKYKPRWRKEDGVDQIQKILRKSFKKDAELGMTTTGPHRDNFIFSLGDDDFLKTASTGQVRLLAIALRVAQARYFFHKTGTKPLLLMDDVLLELDQEKRDKCIKQLPEYSQIFFTFLPNENYINYKNEKTMIYCVENGVFSEWKKPVK